MLISLGFFLLPETILLHFLVYILFQEIDKVSTVI